MQNPFRFVLSSPLVTLRGLLPLCLALASPCSSSAQERLPYQNAKLPLEERVRDLLQRMTLEEKIAQLQSSWQNVEYAKNKAQLFVNPNGEFVPEKAEIALKNGVGEVSTPAKSVALGRWPSLRMRFRVGWCVTHAWVFRSCFTTSVCTAILPPEAQTTPCR